MNATNRFLLVIVVTAIPFMVYAGEKGGGGDGGTTNCAPTMATTPNAKLVIDKWKAEAWKRQNAVGLYRVYSYESKALGDERIYTFAHTRIPGLTNCTVSGFVAIQKPRDLREGWEDKLSAGIVLTIWRTR
jgi:hypothetical protein